MTVCVTALANEGKAIVLVADKALTFGDNIYRPAVQGEMGGVEKYIPIGESGWSALIAGDPTAASNVIRAVEAKLDNNPDISKSYPLMMDCVKEGFQEVREEAVIERILQPNLLTKETYLSRPTNLLPLQDSFFLDLTREVKMLSLGCELLIAGFDEKARAHVFSVMEPGRIISHELEDFGAIGIGAEEEDDLDIALYQAFEAKAYAEKIQGVGTNTDAWIMLPDRSIIPVSDRILFLLARIFNSSSQLPFRKRIGWSPALPPPRNWEAQLKRYINLETEIALHSD